MMEPPYHYHFRIVLIGDATVGKTTLLRVFAENNFMESNEPTIGVDFYSKIIEIDAGIRIKLQLWDTAGQEKFRSITRTYYRNSVGALLIYDATKRASYEHLIDWLHEVRKHIQPYRAIYQIVSCKNDLTDAVETKKDEAAQFASFYKLKLVETSSKTGHNVEACFRTLAQDIYDNLTAGHFKLDDTWEGIKEGVLVKPQNSRNQPISLRADNNGNKKRCC